MYFSTWIPKLRVIALSRLHAPRGRRMNAFMIFESQAAITPWFSRLCSESNPADAPSRLDFSTYSTQCPQVVVSDHALYVLVMTGRYLRPRGSLNNGNLSLVSLAPFCSSSFDTQPLLGFLVTPFRRGLRRTASPCLIRGQLPVLLVGQQEKEAPSDGFDFATLSRCPCDLLSGL